MAAVAAAAAVALEEQKGRVEEITGDILVDFLVGNIANLAMVA
jgi:hypothetical protein